jgi:hypothetical protein
VTYDFDEQNTHVVCLRMSLCPVSGYGWSEFRGERSFRVCGESEFRGERSFRLCGESEFRGERSFIMCGPVDKGASECVA